VRPRPNPNPNSNPNPPREMHDLGLPSSGDASGTGNACLFGLSLCSGAGGLDLGLLLAIPGYRAVGHVERENFAAAILVARMEDASLDQAVVWDDVGTFDGRPWRGAVGIVTAGYPCQPFSVAGKRRGADDPRHLWPHVARIIAEVEPPFVFLENVAHYLRHGFPEVAAGLVGMGYKLAAGLFTAAEVGAPHKRERTLSGARATSSAARSSPHATAPTMTPKTSPSCTVSPTVSSDKPAKTSRSP
jgi:DNA (cytosine-5)-methyltransferase 1